MRIIDNYTTTNGVQLTATTDNPVTITGSCEISIDETAGSAVAVESVNGQPYPWYIKNFGLIAAAGVGSAGVGLFGGGTVFNEGGIGGETQGIYAGYQPATVINFGFISASGSGGRGILLAAGGEVVNDRSILGYVGGIKIEGANATVANYGEIFNTAGSYGVKLYGSLGNLLTNGKTGVIQNGVIAQELTDDADQQRLDFGQCQLLLWRPDPERLQRLDCRCDSRLFQRHRRRRRNHRQLRHDVRLFLWRRIRCGRQL